MPNSFTLPGKVYLIGTEASADLSSYAADLLRRADLVIHDKPVSPELLELIPARTAVRVAGNHAGFSGPAEEISREMIQAALHGQIVVRLKDGSAPVSENDSEVAALREAQVEFEIVSGAAASAAAAGAAR
jgi:siroheme synthase